HRGIIVHGGFAQKASDPKDRWPFAFVEELAALSSSPVGAVYDRAQSIATEPCMVMNRNSVRRHSPRLQGDSHITGSLMAWPTWHIRQPTSNSGQPQKRRGLRTLSAGLFG